MLTTEQLKNLNSKTLYITQEAPIQTSQSNQFAFTQSHSQPVQPSANPYPNMLTNTVVATDQVATTSTCSDHSYSMALTTVDQGRSPTKARPFQPKFLKLNPIHIMDQHHPVHAMEEEVEETELSDDTSDEESTSLDAQEEADIARFNERASKPSEVRTLQLQDKALKQLKQWLESGQVPPFKSIPTAELRTYSKHIRKFELKDGAIFRKFGDKYLPLLPVSEFPRLFQLFHFPSHLSSTKMLNDILERYFMYDLNRSLRTAVMYCESCMKRNNIGTGTGPWKHSFATRPLDKVHIDLIGKFPPPNARRLFLCSKCDR